VTTLQFSGRELRDLGVAWVVLGVAFAILLFRDELLAGGLPIRPVAISLVTAGVGFMLHELAHKVVAVRFGQAAEFRADYGMLFLALMSAMIGFLFAAPGAVHHRGRITEKENGLIALAGPVVNLVLLVPFGAAFVAGGLAGSDLLVDVGFYGVVINGILAAFNMVPYGPLDGRTVLDWSKLVWAAVFLPSLALAAVLLFGVL